MKMRGLVVAIAVTVAVALAGCGRRKGHAEEEGEPVRRMEGMYVEQASYTEPDDEAPQKTAQEIEDERLNKEAADRDHKKYCPAPHELRQR
jgi:hypothetical protein